MCLSLCREVGVCSLHSELYYYLILFETSCKLLGKLVIKHAVTSPCATLGASVDNSLSRNGNTVTFTIYTLMTIKEELVFTKQNRLLISS